MSFIERLYRELYPFFPALVFIIPGLLLLSRRRSRSGMMFIATGLLWLWLSSTSAFAFYMQKSLEQQYPPKEAMAYPDADAIVVLGGGALPNLNGDWNEYPADTDTTRIGFGLKLFRSSKANVILLSGGELEAEQMAGKLLQQGVPENVVQTETSSMSTHENAIYSAAILKREKRQRILLVTSAMHMPRAIASFRRQGLIVIPAPALESTPDAKSKPGISWWPNRAALLLSYHCLREYLGLWTYRLIGWA